MSIPRDLDEAAMIDGASPFRVFLSVILPMSGPALTAVALFHFFYAWNDFFGPLIYLAGNPEKFREWVDSGSERYPQLFDEVLTG